MRRRDWARGPPPERERPARARAGTLENTTCNAALDIQNRHAAQSPLSPGWSLGRHLIEQRLLPPSGLCRAVGTKGRELQHQACELAAATARAAWGSAWPPVAPIQPPSKSSA